MKLHALSLAALGLGLALAGGARADEGAARWYESVKISGYAETYYQALFIEASSARSPQVPKQRVFDIHQNQFSPAGGELIFHWGDAGKTSEAKVDLLFGEKNFTGFYGSSTSSAKIGIGEAELGAFFGPLKLNLGKLTGFLGGESWHSNAESNYSRGLLFAQKPLDFVGLQAFYALPGELTLGALVDNGQDSESYPSAELAASSDKGLGASLAYAGIKDLALGAAWYRNPRIFNASFLCENLASAQLSWQALEELRLKAEYLYICRPLSAGNYSYRHAAALYLDYTTPISGLSLNGRFEQLNQVDIVQVDDSYTLSARYAQGPLHHLLEYRADASNKYLYPGFHASDAKTQIQQTFTYAAVYSF